MTIVRQRGNGDCGTAALATIASLTYDVVDAVMRHVDRVSHGRGGLNNTDIIMAARRLHIRLEPTRRYNLDTDTGVLRIRLNRRAAHRGHFVAIRDGFILCPTRNDPMRWRDYLAAQDGRACTLLRID